MRELTPEELEAVYGGAREVDTSILPRSFPAAAAPASLTPRQAQCLAWVAAGKTSAEIGAALGLSPFIVDTYLKAACKALGVRTRAEATAVAAKPVFGHNVAVGPESSETQYFQGEIK